MVGYDGFISYSHAGDGRLAPALQEGLQRLAKRWNSRRALRVFRDETGLSTNPHLWSAIEAALDESVWFVLLASPEAAGSEWVNREVAHWLATKAADRILPVVTDGLWEWDPGAGDFTPASSAVPAALRGALHDEPRHLDLRWARDETDLDLRNSRFRGAVADLAAPMHGIAKDELEGEDIRQHRRTRRLARGAVSALVVLVVVAVMFAGLAFVQRNRASRNADRANRNATQARAAQTAAELSADEALARGLSAQVGSLVATKHNDLALLLAAEAQRFASEASPASGAAQQARNALLQVLGTDTTFTGYLDGQISTASAVSFSPDGKTIASVNDRGEVRVWDAATRRPLPHQPRLPLFGHMGTLPVSDAGLVATWAGLWDSAAGRMLAWRPPPPDLSSSIPSAFPLALSSRQALATSWTPFGSNTSEFNLWDTTAGQRIGASRQIGGIVTALGFSHDGSTLALDIVAPGGATMDLQLVDARTGALGRRWVAHRARAATPLDPAFTPFFSSVVFSPDGQQVSSVMGASPDGAIATFDTATGTAEPTTGIGKDQNVIGVSPDLAHLIVSTGPCCVAGLPASLIDARTGASLLDLVTPASPDNGQALAFDPNRPDIVFQHGDGALGILDWTKPGPSPFAQGAAGPPSGPTVALSPGGSVVDLAAPLRTLGLDGSPNPLRPWSASPSGQVAILGPTSMAIWDPVSQRIVRQLSGVPAGCPATGKPIIDFVGTDTTGRVVLGCTPKLVFWDLSKPGADPLWSEAWAGVRFDEPFGPVISPDGTTIADTDTIGTVRLLDARTGAVRARGPTAGPDNLLQLSFSSDSRILATSLYGAEVTLLNTTDGSVIQTLHSQINGADNGGYGLPVVAISPDHAYVAAWHYYGGVEVWDTASGVSLAVLNVQQAGDGPLQPGDQPVGADGEPVTPEAVALDRHAGGTGKVQYQRGALSFSSDGATLRFDALVGYQPSGAPVYDRLSTVRWSMGGDGLVRAACGIVGRDLTVAEWQHYVGSGVPYHHTCTG